MRPAWSREVRRWLRLTLLSVAATILLMSVTIWLDGGGLSGNKTSADVITSLGRITGLLGADSLLFQIMLMVRLPFVELTFGWPQISRWHKLNGKI